MKHEKKLIEDNIHTFESAAKQAKQLLGKYESNKGLKYHKDYYLGMAAYTVRNYDIAYEALNSAYIRKPSGEIAARLAMTELRKNNPEKAVNWIQKAIAENPRGLFKTFVSDTEIPYLSILSSAEFARGNIDDSLLAADNALSISPGDSMASQVAVMGRLINGNTDVALEIAEKSPYLSSKMHPIYPFLEMARDVNESGLEGLPLKITNKALNISAAAEAGTWY